MTATMTTRTLPSRSLAPWQVERWSAAFWCAAAAWAPQSLPIRLTGARAALCHDDFSARQGVEDDDLNILCFGGRTMGIAVAWDCAKNFLGARFSGADRHRRRLAKVTQFETGMMAASRDGRQIQSVQI